DHAQDSRPDIPAPVGERIAGLTKLVATVAEKIQAAEVRPGAHARHPQLTRTGARSEASCHSASVTALDSDSAARGAKTSGSNCSVAREWGRPSPRRRSKS